MYQDNFTVLPRKESPPFTDLAKATKSSVVEIINGFSFISRAAFPEETKARQMISIKILFFIYIEI